MLYNLHVKGFWENSVSSNLSDFGRVEFQNKNKQIIQSQWFCVLN